MGSISLKCPFCCDEKFPSHLSLKYHILSLIDNIFCPACNERFENVLELTEHLDRECKDQETLVDNIKFGTEDDGLDLNTLDNENEDSHIEDSVVTKVLLGNSENESMENVQENVSYLCKMCNMHFESIQEHLEQYHVGQEVILETEENDIQLASILETEPEADYLSETNNIPNSEMPETDCENETVNEAYCLDKEGRAYTRKIVKIDKFWMDQKYNAFDEQFVLENVKLKKNCEMVNKTHKCRKCNLEFAELTSYIKHICDPTKVTSKLKCMYCTSVFSDYQSLNTHLKTHFVKDKDGHLKRVITLGPYNCEICNTMFPSFKNLRLHQRMHDPVKDKLPDAPVKYTPTGNIQDTEDVIRNMFTCEVCNNTYDKQYEEVHMKSHNQEENYDCSICNRKFYTKENLEMHAKAHLTVKKFACSYCKKPFTTYESLQLHVKNYCQKRQYECQYCGRRFSRPHEKVKHERIHTGEKPHVCQICGKSFRVSYCLTLHLRTHSGMRPYQCKHCGKRFKSHSVYNHHLLTHSDVRAYKCPYCPKTFKTGVQLAGHRNSHIKPFTCTECNRPFASLYAVRTHMESHKRENNLKFDCWLCGATYARAFALKDHMTNQHAGESVMGVDDNVLIELETAESAERIEHEMEAEDVEQAEENM